jgi:hypothetical protein
MRRIRPRLNHATVVAYLALFVALGGSSYAAVKINGKSIKNGSIPGAKLEQRTITALNVAKKTLTGTEIRDGSLLAADFKAGELRAGPQGPQGARGDNGVPGPKGDTGAPGSNGATNVVVRTVAAVHPTGQSSVAACNPGERATGGGGAITSPGDTINSSVPYFFNGTTYTAATAGQTPNAWFIGTNASLNPPVWVVCASP